MRTETVIFKVSKEEQTTIKVEAEKLGMTVSSFIRLLLRQWYNGVRFEKEKEKEPFVLQQNAGELAEKH